MAILGILALLVFGEQKLPGIMRQAGRIMREVQNTSQSFVREMERAADMNEPVRPEPARPDVIMPDPVEPEELSPEPERAEEPEENEHRAHDERGA
jgi:Sec-independent protein translocase protein TatA